MFIEYFRYLAPRRSLGESPEVSVNLAASRLWWAQWWAHETIGNYRRVSRTQLSESEQVTDGA